MASLQAIGGSYCTSDRVDADLEASHFWHKDTPADGDHAGAGLNAAKSVQNNSDMSPAIKQIIEWVASWPEEDQEALAEVAREIEARRSGVYSASADELHALDEAERSGIASADEVEAAFRSIRGR